MKLCLKSALLICLAGCVSCDQMVSFRSERTNSKFEIVDYGDFEVTADVGRGNMGYGNVLAIAIRIKTSDSLIFWADRLQINYQDLGLTYDIMEGGQRPKNTYRLFREEKIVVYFTRHNVFSIPKGDQILLYGSQIFQIGERFYDLDTLKFVALKSYPRNYH